MKLIKLACIFILLLCSEPVIAGDAVSSLNGKMAFSYGDMDSNRGKNLTGSVSSPISKNIGIQIDGLYTNVSDRDFYGAGIQIFWRDSEIGLLGGSFAGVNESDMYSLTGGFVGEYYLDLFTFGLSAGYAKINYDNPVLFIDTDKTEPYIGCSIGVYPIDDLLFEFAYNYVFENHLYQCNIEYQTPLNGLCVFADLAKGDNDYDQSLFGLRYYFGKQKTLKKRHREDDPQNAVNGVLSNIGTYGAEYNASVKKYNARAQAYNENLLNDPGITPLLFEQYAMPVYDNPDDFGFLLSTPYEDF
ncbi:MAG: hypothetical protein MI892_09730 [Desulfobacterales bacterium]|nr:hypothetical protein [Desulfobacterales bacterium]